MSKDSVRKELNVPLLEVGRKAVPPEVAVRILGEQVIAQKLDQVPWKRFPYQPQVCFRIAWTHREMLLRYDVAEDDIKSDFLCDNDPVHKDSCVEFFIAPGDGSYFNFEINPRGVIYAARGTGRADSIPLQIETVEKIQRYSTLNDGLLPDREKPASWTLGITIPLSLFSGTLLENPGGRSFRANFYKCGDDTRRPHFVTWNAVGTEEPDFHRPEYFGVLHFGGTEEKENNDA